MQENVRKEGTPPTHGTGWIFATRKSDGAGPSGRPSNARVWGLSLAGIASSKPTWGVDVCRLVNVVCFQVEVSATVWSLIQRSLPSVVCLSDREALAHCCALKETSDDHNREHLSLWSSINSFHYTAYIFFNLF